MIPYFIMQYLCSTFICIYMCITFHALGMYMERQYMMLNKIDCLSSK